MVDLLNKKYASGGSIVISTEDHVESIYPFIRQQDKIEIGHQGYLPKEALDIALEFDDETYTVLDEDDVPFAMFGVGALHADEGYIWMLSTDTIYDYKNDFLRYSKFWIKNMTNKYSKYTNWVHKENSLSVRWLLWCGATFVEETQINDAPFIKFQFYNIK